MAVAAAVAARKRRKILEAFREAGALSADRAVSQPELGLRGSAIFRRLVRSGVLIECGDERYYLDEEAAARAHYLRVRRFALLMATVSAVLLVIWILERS